MIAVRGSGCGCSAGLGSQQMETARPQGNLETIGQVYRVGAIALGFWLAYHLYKAGTR